MAGKGEGPAIGIDLGTTYSCVGVWQHDWVEIIANDEGNRTTPFSFFTDSERLIGDVAKNQVAMHLINTVFVQEPAKTHTYTQQYRHVKYDNTKTSRKPPYLYRAVVPKAVTGKLFHHQIE